MTTSPELPGLDRLITICRQHRLPCDLSPPLSTAPKAGDRVFGQPFDPMLAALYQRTSGTELGTFSLFRPDRDPEEGFFPENESFRRHGEEPFLSAHLFSKETGFSYYLGTVPALADAYGIQPVVYIPYYPGETSGIPIASSLDRFFDTYSRYLELMVVDEDYVETGTPGVTFPWGIAHLVAQDGPLVAFLRAGRFVPLMNDYRGARKWVTDVLSTLM